MRGQCLNLVYFLKKGYDDTLVQVMEIKVVFAVFCHLNIETLYFSSGCQERQMIKLREFMVKPRRHDGFVEKFN